eukprot:jgi/Mesvir1/3138/Mv16309-RA.1
MTASAKPLLAGKEAPAHPHAAVLRHPVNHPHPVPADDGRKLTVYKLVAITCASSAYGLEDCVGAGGPLYALIGILVFVLCWSIPTALMTAEMTCLIPENGGQILWVDRAFGQFWSFTNGFMALFVNVLDGAALPVLFLDYLSQLLGLHLDQWTRMIIGFLVLAMIVIINVLGSHVVGGFAVVIAFVAASPFLLMILLGAPSIAPAAVLQRPASFHVGRFASMMLWNWAGFEGLGSYAGEVRDPSRDVPMALMCTVAIAATMYTSVITVGASVFPDYAMWVDGSFEVVAEIVGGRPLATWLQFGASVGVLGELCGLLMVSSHLVYGMGTVGTLPKIFATKSERFGTPLIAMLFSAVVMSLFTFLPFEVLAEAEIFFYCISVGLCYGALLKFRFAKPDKKRPFRIPLDTVPLCAVCVLPAVVVLVVLTSATGTTLLIGLAGFAISTSAYFVARVLLGHKGAMIDMDSLEDI